MDFSDLDELDPENAIEILQETLEDLEIAEEATVISIDDKNVYQHIMYVDDSGILFGKGNLTGIKGDYVIRSDGKMDKVDFTKSKEEIYNKISELEKTRK